jgi:hypothetical protein
MVSKSKSEMLNDLAERLFGPRQHTILSQFSAPFDISRPNIHDSKKAFLMEQRIVKNVISCLSGILTELHDPKNEDPSEWTKISNQVALAVEMSAVRRKRPSVPKVPLDLVMQNLTQVGFYSGSISVIAEMAEHFIERNYELSRQEAEFWTVKNRPPNYYARTIALRFAKLYATQKRAKPTFGTSKDGGHPSTDFGRALEEVFQILSIKANLKRSAEWAIAELVEDDWNPKNTLGSILGLSGIGAYNAENALGAIPDKSRRKGF